jgi:hypothetical protein
MIQDYSLESILPEEVDYTLEEIEDKIDSEFKRLFKQESIVISSMSAESLGDKDIDTLLTACEALALEDVDISNEESKLDKLKAFIKKLWKSFQLVASKIATYLTKWIAKAMSYLSTSGKRASNLIKLLNLQKPDKAVNITEEIAKSYNKDFKLFYKNYNVTKPDIEMMLSKQVAILKGLNADPKTNKEYKEILKKLNMGNYEIFLSLPLDKGIFYSFGERVEHNDLSLVKDPIQGLIEYSDYPLADLTKAKTFKDLPFDIDYLKDILSKSSDRLRKAIDEDFALYKDTMAVFDQSIDLITDKELALDYRKFNLYKLNIIRKNMLGRLSIYKKAIKLATILTQGNNDETRGTKNS